MIQNFPNDVLHYIFDNHFHFTKKQNYKNVMYLRSTSSLMYHIVRSYCDSHTNDVHISPYITYKLNPNHIPEVCIVHDNKSYAIPCNMSSGSFDAKHVKEKNTTYVCLFADPRNQEVYVYLKKLHGKRNNETIFLVFEEDSHVSQEIICRKLYTFFLNFLT